MPLIRNDNMKCVRRFSMNDNFEVNSSHPIPNVPTGGARVKVCYAGACYTNDQLLRSGQKRPKMPGIHDTSLFPGFEVSGVIDSLCDTIENNNYKLGDKVVVYPDDDEIIQGEYAEYISVKDVDNLLILPESMSLELGALLPCGALTAYSAVIRAKPFVEDFIKKKNLTNILIVGAGGLGLWTLKLAKHFIGGDCGKVHIAVADTNIEKLMVAQDYGCYDVVHWHDADHEEYLLERTRDVCQGGVDVVIDFVSSARTVHRAMKVLNKEGILLVGGNSRYEVNICLNTLAQKQQSILGVNRGTREQLRQLIEVFADGKISAPCYSVFPVEKANSVFEDLSQCRINGRAVLEISSPTTSS